MHSLPSQSWGAEAVLEPLSRFRTPALTRWWVYGDSCRKDGGTMRGRK